MPTINDALIRLGDGDVNLGLRRAVEQLGGSFGGLTANQAIWDLASGSLTVLIDQFGDVWVEDGKAVTTRDVSYFGGL
jgi:hypothetical protein